MIGRLRKKEMATNMKSSLRLATRAGIRFFFRVDYRMLGGPEESPDSNHHMHMKE